MNKELEKDIISSAYEEYFGCSKVKSAVTDNIHLNKKPYTIKSEKLRSNGNISTLDEFGELLSKMLNVIWGYNWGELSPEESSNIDSNNIKMPSIRYSTNLREISENKSPKPTLIDITNEDDDNVYRTYSQLFDCIVEFNIRDTSSKSCNELANKFEDALIFHAGFLKKNGISEIYFLKEVPSQYSFSFIEKIPTKTLYYFVRLEKNKIESVNYLKKIESNLDLIIGKQSENDSIDFSIQKESLNG